MTYEPKTFYKSPLRPAAIWAAKANRLLAHRDIRAKDLAAHLGVTEGDLSKMRKPSGQRVFRPKHVPMLAEFFGVDEAWWMDGRPDSDPPGQAASATEEERALLEIVRRLGYRVAFERLMALPSDPVVGVASEPVAPAEAPAPARRRKPG